MASGTQRHTCQTNTIRTEKIPNRTEQNGSDHVRARARDQDQGTQLAPRPARRARLVFNQTVSPRSHRNNIQQAMAFALHSATSTTAVVVPCGKPYKRRIDRATATLQYRPPPASHKNEGAEHPPAHTQRRALDTKPRRQFLQK